MRSAGGLTRARKMTGVNMANGRTERRPLLLSIADYQVLAYEGTNGIRVAAWKHRTRVTDGGMLVKFEIQEANPQIAAQRFQTVPELEDGCRFYGRPSKRAKAVGPIGTRRRGASVMRTDPRKVRELLEEYASLIPFPGNVPRQDKALMRDLDTELLKLGCLFDIDLDLPVA
jgi:hypothetical protein